LEIVGVLLIKFSLQKRYFSLGQLLKNKIWTSIFSKRIEITQASVLFIYLAAADKNNPNHE
jgi:hypothetical protein